MQRTTVRDIARNRPFDFLQQSCNLGEVAMGVQASCASQERRATPQHPPSDKDVQNAKSADSATYARMQQIRAQHGIMTQEIIRIPHPDPGKQHKEHTQLKTGMSIESDPKEALRVTTRARWSLSQGEASRSATSR